MVETKDHCKLHTKELGLLNGSGKNLRGAKGLSDTPIYVIFRVSVI